MQQSKTSKLMLWSIGMMCALLLVVSGVTFAALQSQPAVLQGNTIQTAVASLQVSPNGVNYSSTMDGYVFGNLVPGGLSSPANGYPVYIKNVGTTPLAVRISVNSPITNPNSVDLSKAHIILAPASGGAAQNNILQDLITAGSTGGLAVNQASHLLPGEVTNFLLKASLDSDAFSGPGATLSNIDFSFSAIAVN